jgi:hypothetical protein
LDRPDSLLKSALEKVVFFECRIDQLTAELVRAGDESERLKEDLAHASQRELDLKRELADAAAKITLMARERDEARRKADLFLAERERFLGRLIESEQIRRSGDADAEDGVDLAAFIAELRGEVMRLTAELDARGGAGRSRNGEAAPSAPPAESSSVAASLPSASPSPALDDLTPAFRSTDEVAQAFASKGRIGIGEPELDALRAATSFQSRSEETLFALSLRELSAPDASTRLRAAARLKSMNPRAALPALASALHAEADADTCKVLIEAVADAASPSALPLLSPHLSSPNLELRLTALEAAFRLGAKDCLSRALDDDAPLVRRRAVVLASGQADQADILERAVRDPDAAVRRVAALGLGATATARTFSTALLMALDDRDEAVRRAAARGLATRFGPEVHAVAEMDASRRRREVRRLAALETPRATVSSSAEIIARRLASISKTLHAVDSPVPAALQPLPSVQSPPKPRADAEGALAEAIVSRIYGALRGQTAGDLADALSFPRERVQQVAVALAESGRIVRRGQRFFVP